MGLQLVIGALLDGPKRITSLGHWGVQKDRGGEKILPSKSKNKENVQSWGPQRQRHNWRLAEACKAG